MNNPNTIKNIVLLMVESNALNVKRFKELICDKGYTMNSVCTSMEAIRWIKNNGAPSLLIIEENSSPLNGLQTFDYLRIELNLKLPVLIGREEKYDSIGAPREFLGFIDRPYTNLSVLQLNEFFPKNGENKTLVNNGYSLTYLKELSDNNAEFISSSIQIFNDSVTKKLLEIDDSLDKKDYENIREIAHNIKPSFAMLENEYGSLLCDSVVYDAQEKDIAELVEQLNTLFLDLKSQLKNDFPIII